MKKMLSKYFILGLCFFLVFTFMMNNNITEADFKASEESKDQDVVKVIPGVPTLVKEGGLNKYQFENLKINVPDGKLIKNIIVQFTSAIEDNDKIILPTGYSQFQVLSGSTVANQSINTVSEEGLSAQQWEEYLRGIVVQLSSTQNKTMRFTANTEQKAEYIYDYNAANKHYYQLVVISEEDFINDSSFDGGKRAPRFSDAYQAIEVDKKYQYMNRTGYMVTVTDEQEMRFVTSVIKNGDFVWLGATCASPYVDEYLQKDGYTNNPNNANYGRFYWISGPEKGKLMWEGNRKGSALLNNLGYTTFWISTATSMEYGLINSGTHGQDYDVDGLYVATFPTKATYWVWCDQPEDVNGDGFQGYGKQIINWMIEYDDIPEMSTATTTVQSFELDPKLEAISLEVSDIKYGETIEPIAKKAGGDIVQDGLVYKYYGLKDGQYTEELSEPPTQVGSYKVVVSGDGYTSAESTFSILPLKIDVNIDKTTYGEDLKISIQDEKGNPPVHTPTYKYYQKDDKGEYTIELPQQPQDVGDYQVVISIEGYEETKKNFSIEPKEVIISALANGKKYAGTISDGGKLSDIRVGDDLKSQSSLLGDDISFFGQPQYEWYSLKRQALNPEDIKLKVGDVYLLKVSYPQTADSKQLDNYSIHYRDYTLTVIEKNHVNDQLTIIIDDKTDKIDKEDLSEIIQQQYPSVDDHQIVDIEDIIIYDQNHNDVTENGIDLSKPGKYIISVTVVDEDGHRTVIDYQYIVKGKENIDTKDDNQQETILAVDTSDTTYIFSWISMLTLSLLTLTSLMTLKKRK